MRVLLLVSRIPYPPDDGVVIPVYELLRTLAARHQVILGCFVDERPAAGAVPDALRPLAERVVLLPKRSRRQLLWPAGWSQPLGGVPLSIFPYTSPEARREVGKIVDDARIDALLCHMVHTGHAVPPPLRSGACMIVQDAVHTQIRQNLRFLSPARRVYGALDARLMQRYEAAIYPRFRPCYVVSPAEEARVKALDPSIETEVVPNGVDPNVYRPEPETPRGRSLVYVGALTGFRNEEAAWLLASEIFPLLAARFPDLALDIVGKGPSARLRDVAARNRAIHLTGAVDDVSGYLRRAGVFVCPQVVGTGIKNSILQALASGVPVLASPAALEGIAGVDGRDYIICRSSPEFVDAAASLLTAPGLAASLAVQGRQLVLKRYTWTAYAQAIEAGLLRASARLRGRSVPAAGGEVTWL